MINNRRRVVVESVGFKEVSLVRRALNIAVKTFLSTLIASLCIQLKVALL